MANIDSQINDRIATYGNNPQALQQRYAQTQELVDLLALQKMKNDRAAATNALQGAMQTNTNTYKGQLEQEAMQGARNDVLRSMGPGIQQQGVRTAQMQNRAAMGLPTQPAPNMRFAASGGLIGYADGGAIMGPPEPNLYQRMGQGLKNYGTNAQESMDILRAAKAGIGVPYENRSAAIQQVRDQIAAEKQNRDPNFIQHMGQKLMNAGLNVEESKSILKKFYDTFGKTYEEMSKGMAMGGIVGYQQGGDVDIDALLDALMMAESGGDPRAVSDVGAEGAYQIMPATAADPGFGVSPMEGSRFDPEASREFAGDYLQAMLDRYGGDREAALVAYNAGPANADKFVAAGKDYDVLPQAMQTQPYVSRVLGGVEKEDEPILDIGSGIEYIKEGVASLFRPSRATAEARRIERGQMERQGQEAAQRGERVVEALDVPRLTPEQIANVGAAADVEVLPQAAERLPERVAAETERRERVARREAAGIPTVAPTNVTVPTRAEAFRQTPLGNVMEVQNMMEDMYGPTPKQQPAPERNELDIDFRALREFLAGGAGQTSAAGALASGATRLGAFQSAEQSRQDKINQAAAELQLKRDLAANDARMLSARLAAEYQGKMDAEAFKVAQDALEDTRDPLNQEFQAQAAEIRDRYKRQPVVMETALDNLRDTYINKAVARARQAVGVGGAPTTATSVRDLGLE